MKFVERIVMIILITAVVLLFTFPLIFAEVLNISSGHKSSIEVMVDNIVDTVKNGKKYDKYAKEYLHGKFGVVLVSRLNMSGGDRVDSNKYAYTLKLNELLSKSFILYVRSDGICYDNLSEVIRTDKKFQHLYSEWVKKQVGIDDENVEFGFAGNFDDPYIDFDKITTLSEDYREVFENTHNLYCNKCYINNLFELNEENAKVIADELRNKYLFNASKITGMPQKKLVGIFICLQMRLIVERVVILLLNLICTISVVS